MKTVVANCALAGLTSLGLLATSAFAASQVDAIANCAHPGFIAPDAYAVPVASAALAQGDFNGDGRPDILSLSNDATSHFTVLLGNADGTFQPPLVTDEDFQAQVVTVGDFDGDGKLDVVAGAGFAYWFLGGIGDGSFAPPIEVTGNFDWIQVMAARVDDDANLDLVVFDAVASRVLIYLGNGDGSFQDPILLDDTAKSFAVAKLDSDAHADLALTGGLGGGITIYPGNGDGTFGSPATLEPGTDLDWVRAADLNGDGNVDLVAPTSFDVNTYLGHGDGTFDAGVRSVTTPGAWSAELGDFDGDGVLDLATVAFNDIDPLPPSFAVFPGLGDGTFAQGQYYVLAGLGPLLVADFGNDGVSDVAFANGGDSLVMVARARGDGTVAAQRLFGASQYFVYQTALGDFDGDGQPDVAQAILFGADPNVFVWLLNPDLTARTVNEYRLPGGVAQGLAMADFDGDGTLDLVAVGVDSIQTLRGDGHGNFDPPIASPGPSGAVFGAVVQGDLDGDGFPDLVIATQNANASFGALNIRLNNGDGTFRVGSTIPLFVVPTSLVLAQFSSDADLDLAVVGQAGPSGQLLILRGLGDGNFAAAGAYDTPTQPLAVVAADLIEDGTLDLAVLTGFPSRLAIFQGFNDAFFGPFSATDLPFAYAATLAAGDFDGDGHADLTTGNSFLAGHGDGSFEEAVFYGTYFTPRSLATADVDRNGTLDAFASSFNISALLLSARLSVQVRQEQPSIIVGSPISLEASVTGFGTLTYQWRKNGVPLSDGGPISGVTTATLTINPVAFTDAGSYDVVVTDSCTNITSNAATLSVEFDDVPLSSPFHNDIITIATAGITGGCNTGSSYCPSNPVSRAEMAVLLLKARYGADHVPPPPPPVPIFPDVPADAFAAAWIDELATLNITAGCGDGSGNYCPDASVTRGQMAVFLLKTLMGAGYAPPTPAGIFVDVPADYFAIAWIEDLFNRGITTGCSLSPLKYCPDENVPREQMATFLVRTFLGP